MVNDGLFFLRRQAFRTHGIRYRRSLNVQEEGFQLAAFFQFDFCAYWYRFSTTKIYTARI